MQTISLESLKEYLLYEAKTGVFTWAKKISRKTIAATNAGSLTNCGYWSIRLHKKAYQAHRLAWFYFYGEWPKGELDHINGNRTDNRISNLRDVSGFINRQNIRVAKSTSKTSVLGVSVKGKGRRYQARITTNKVSRYLGSFLTVHEAHEAYLNAKRAEHTGCTI